MQGRTVVYRHFYIIFSVQPSKRHLAQCYCNNHTVLNVGFPVSLEISLQWCFQYKECFL